MSVFDGGTYRVKILMQDWEETEHYPEDVREFVTSLRGRSDVRAVETNWIHFVVGSRKEDLSFSSFEEAEEDDE